MPYVVCATSAGARSWDGLKRPQYLHYVGVLEVFQYERLPLERLHLLGGGVAQHLDSHRLYPPLRLVHLHTRQEDSDGVDSVSTDPESMLGFLQGSREPHDQSADSILAARSVDCSAQAGRSGMSSAIRCVVQ